MADVTGDGLGAPAVNGYNVVPSDSADLSPIPRALYIGCAGHVAVMMRDGSSLTFAGCTAGTFLPVRVNRVLSTGTSATLILGLY